MISCIKEILVRRNLIRELVLKDLKVRYSKPMLGFLWVFLLPFITAIIFYIIFYLFLKVKIEEAPFLLYLMSAVFPWQFFQDSLNCSTTSLIDSKNLIRESNFPHYLIPVSIALGKMINFLPSLGILIFVSLFILKGLPVFILFLPVVLLLHLMLATGLSIMLSILFVRWRDIKYISEAALLLLFYLTPAFYSTSIVKASFHPLLYKIYICNPLVGILNLYRIALLKGFYGVAQKDNGLAYFIASPLLFAVVSLAVGLYLYEKNKKGINDYISC